MLVIYFIIFSSMKSQLMWRFEERIKRLFAERTNQNDTMQPIHSLFRCCGLEGPQDYLVKEHGALPASCCYAFDCTVSRHIYQEGCGTKAIQGLQFQADVNYYAAIAIFVLEVKSANKYSLSANLNNYLLQLLSMLFAFLMGKARKLLKIKDDETPISED